MWQFIRMKTRGWYGNSWSCNAFKRLIKVSLAEIAVYQSEVQVATGQVV